MAVTTELKVSSQPQELDKNIATKIEVTTNATSYDVSIADPKKIELVKEDTYFTLKGLELGSSKIEVIATATGGTEKRITWTAEVKVLPNKLEITDTPSTIYIGEEKLLNIVTTGVDLEFSYQPTGVVEANSTKTGVVGIGVGSTEVTVKSVKEGVDPIEKKFTINCIASVSTSDLGVGAYVKLTNNKTGKSTILRTSDNESATDIIVEMPTKSGVLVTEESYLDLISKISTPTIITPKNGTTDFTGNFVSSDFNSKENMTHMSSVWEFAKDANFKNVTTISIDKYNKGKLSLVELQPSMYGTYYVRVKYKSEEYESQWSNVVQVTISIPAIHNTKVIASKDGNNYYGEVDMKELVDDYNYRGTFNTIKNAYDPNKYGTPSDTSPIYMKKGYQVLHDGKLWYALKTMENKSKDTMVVPGTDDTNWKIDDRVNLGTPRLLLEMIGIGFNINDGGASGNATGSNTIDGPVNHELGYLQYTYNDKLCFTTPKPISYVIGWNDIMQREAAMCNRTVRLGKHLYWIRLMYEDEYKMLFTNLLDGSFDKKEVADYDLDKKVWIHDTKEGSTRSIMYADAANNNALTKGELDPKSRTGSYRFVLEYIPDQLEPWKNQDLYFPKNRARVTSDTYKASNSNQYFEYIEFEDGETFIYDRYSDTGYFGLISTTELIGGNELASRCGYTSGSAQQDTAGWIKFYWHGALVYCVKKQIRYNTCWDHMNAHNVLFGWCSGKNNSKFLDIQGAKYRINVWTGSKYAPYDHSKYSYNNDSKYKIAHLNTEAWQYSHYGELITRCSNAYVGYEQTANSTTWYTTHIDQCCGYQLGDNWVKMTHTDCGMFYQYEGNGTADYPRERGSGNYAIHLGYYGFGRWHCQLAPSDVYQYMSWRAVATLDPVKS